MWVPESPENGSHEPRSYSGTGRSFWPSISTAAIPKGREGAAMPPNGFSGAWTLMTSRSPANDRKGVVTVPWTLYASIEANPSRRIIANPIACPL